MRAMISARLSYRLDSPSPPYSGAIFIPNDPMAARPLTTSSGMRASPSMSAPSTDPSQNSRSRARNSSPRRADSSLGRGSGWT
jgi:hypothetical protein